MHTKYVRSALLMIFAMHQSMAVAQGAFSLKLKAPKDSSIKRIHVYIPTDAAPLIFEGALKNGIYEFTGSVQEPVLANLIVTHKKGPDEMLFNFLVVEKGMQADIDASKGFSNVSYQGSPIQREFSVYKHHYDRFYYGSVKARAAFFEAASKKDTAMMYHWSDHRRSLIDSLRLLHESTFRTSSPLLTGLLLPVYVTNDWRYVKEAKGFLLSLPEQVRRSVAVTRFEAKLERAVPTSLGMHIPDISMRTVDGRTIDLQRPNGKYVLIDFWASWCRPCFEEFPFIRRAYELFSDRLEVVGVSIDPTLETLKSSIQQQQLPWSNVHDPDQIIAGHFNVTGIPRNFLIDPSGKVVAVGIKDIQLIKFLSEQK